MARRFPALAGAICTVLLLSMPAAGAASSSTAKTSHGTVCIARAAADAGHATKSFHHVHCARGKARKGSGDSSHKSRELFFTAHDGVCRDADLSPTVKNVSLVRAATLCLVNRERARHGEPALHWNEQLIRAAQAHTESMAFGNYFEHIGPGGETPLMRMRRTGYIYSSRIGYEVGENIAWGSLWLGTPRAVVAAWMASPGHRANILDGRYRDTGIGVSPHVAGLAHGQSGGIYTQDFGVRIG
jgi:uncharacterized protein YkwD